MFVGIDVGADRLHCVALGRDRGVCGASLFASADLDRLVEWCGGAEAVAIDAPAQTSTRPHAGCTALAPKFRAARCAEIDLGRRFGHWVPWVAPPERPASGWIATGLAVFEALAEAGAPSVIEVFPYAGFRALAGGVRLAKKTTVAGTRERIRLLAGAGIEADAIEVWSHDGLDAALAALVAHQHAAGHAVAAGCGHDDSAIWLPVSEARRR